MSEHGDWTERAVSEEMREVALVARSRGFTLRGCAKKIGVRHTTALQHLRAVKPRRETVERWKGGLGISDADILSMRAGSRAQRVDAGPRYLTDDDLAHYRRSLIRSAALCEHYRDPAKAAQMIQDALDGLSKANRRSILYLVARETAPKNEPIARTVAGAMKRAKDSDLEPPWPAGSQSVRKLCEKAGVPAPSFLKKRRDFSDGHLWALALALVDMGYSHDEARNVSDLIADDLLTRLGRVNAGTVAAWKRYRDEHTIGALAFGDDEHRALARRVLNPEEKDEA
ncbi:MAG: hypothetical protein WAJ85_10080 [Candidatus Baltobacteraceae bacterium]